MPKGWGTGRSDTGWMTGECFFEFITNVFYKWLVDNNIPMPIILFLDGHSSHLSLPVTQFCSSKGIILIALLPNSTHRLQPLDVAVFHPVKNAWKNQIKKWRLANNGQKLRREHFASQLNECLKDGATAETIKNGFRTCGLFPFNPNNIDYSKLLLPVAINNTPKKNPADCASDCAITSSQFERRLDAKKLNEFQNSGPNWSGPIEDQSLFYFWKMLKDEGTLTTLPNDDAINAHDTTLSNNLPLLDVDSIDLGLNYSGNLWIDDTDNDVLIDDFELTASIPQNHGKVEVLYIQPVGQPDAKVWVHNAAESTPRPRIKSDYNVHSPPNSSGNTWSPNLANDNLPLNSKELSGDNTAYVKRRNLNNINDVNCTDNKDCDLDVTESLSIAPIKIIKEATSAPEEIAISIDLEDANLKTDSALVTSSTIENVPLNSKELPEDNAVNDKQMNLNDIFDVNCTDNKDCDSDFIESTKSLPIAPTKNIEKATSGPEQISILIVSEDANLKTQPAFVASSTIRPLNPFDNIDRYEKTPNKENNKENLKSPNIPTPFKNVTTPFKKALFWPEANKNSNTKKVSKKLTPTVATSEEFLEYQKKIDGEKKKKEEEKSERAKKRKDREKELSSKQTKTANTGDKFKSKIKLNNRANNDKTTGEEKYVIVTYEEEYFPGLVLDSNLNGAVVKAMAMSGGNWKWPEKDDIMTYRSNEIIRNINPPKLINRRGIYCVPEIDELKKVTCT